MSWKDEFNRQDGQICKACAQSKLRRWRYRHYQ
jgi:hypothetical protein